MMRKNNLKITLALTSWLGIFTMIYCSWWTIDFIEFGTGQPSVSDTIFGILLAYLLYDKLITALNKEVSK